MPSVPTSMAAAGADSRGALHVAKAIAERSVLMDPNLAALTQDPAPAFCWGPLGGHSSAP